LFRSNILNSFMDRTSRAKRQCFNVNLFIDDDLAVRASLRQKYAVLHAGLNALDGGVPDCLNGHR